MTHPAVTRWLAHMRKVMARVSGRVRVERFAEPGARPQALRVLYVANAFIPTLQLSFVKPLQPLVDAGEVVAELLSEQQMKDLFGKAVRGDAAREWTTRRIAEFRPDILLFCRYSGPHADAMLDQARAAGIATIFHVDDDLQRVPPEIGQAKYEFHNHPTRVGAVQALLDRADVVYCSTPKLLERFRERGLDGRGRAGHIYCSGEVMAPPAEGEPFKIGYMGFDHAHDFQLALPALVRVLEANPQVHFELFGSIPKPPELERFGDRVATLPPVPDYQQFMAKFASLGWAIGICPLADTPFNAVKANTKWVEYTSIGAAVVATAGTVYDECAAGGCGVLVEDGTAAWTQALQALVTQPRQRLEIVRAAQQRLAREYSPAMLRLQVLQVFRQSLRREHPVLQRLLA
jgi:glycosyltransferase involved in cell wall biosynthesis